MDHLDTVTTAAMGYIIGRLKNDIAVPFGVHAISDPKATVDLAAPLARNSFAAFFPAAMSATIRISIKTRGPMCAGKWSLASGT